MTRSYTVLDRDNKQLTRIADYPDSVSNEVSVTVNGLLVSSTGKTGMQRLFAYDGLGRQIGVTDPRTGTTTTHYNEKGRVDYVEDSAGNRTSYLYDEETGLHIRVTDPLLNAVHTAYDSQGRVIGTWGATYPVLYDYDDYGRMSAMYTLRDNEIGANTSYSGFRSQLSGFDKTSWFYDEATGLLTNKQDAAGKGPVYTYTPDGLIASRTWARLNESAGLLTTYSYRPATRELVGIDYSDDTPDISFGYDRLGRQISIDDGLGTRLFTYSPQSALLSEEVPEFGTIARKYEVGISNGFDLVSGRSAGFSFGTNVNITYRYDDVGRFTSISSSLPAINPRLPDLRERFVAYYSYLPSSALISLISNSHFQVSYSYAPNLDIRTQILNTAGSTIVSRYNYTHDAAGRRTRVDWTDGTYWQYGYDARGQVISANKHWSNGMPVAGQQYGYGYDPIGNRKTTDHGPWVADYTANSLNQYTERTVPGAVDVMGTADGVVNVNGRPAMKQGNYFYAGLGVDNSSTSVFTEVNVTSVQQHAGPSGEDIVDEEAGNAFVPETPEQFEYDEDGNLIRDGRWEYVWDCENRLVTTESQATVPDSFKRRLVFDYDFQGRRVRKTVESGYSGGVYSATNVTTFVWDGWNLIAEYSSTGTTNYYVWGLGGLHANTRLSGSSINIYDYYQDELGNIVQVLDQNAEGEVARYEYDVFGELIRASGSEASNNVFRYSSKEFDSETGLIYSRYRYYAPVSGRFISRDPIKEQGGQNLYVYCANNPVNFIDPLGLWGASVHYRLTKTWAIQEGYPIIAATEIGIADDNVDSGATSPFPGGNQSYHFNRSSGGVDSRIQHYRNHMVGAKIACTWSLLHDDPIRAIKELGLALHPLQDWVAHGDFGRNQPRLIFIPHNMMSPQLGIGGPMEKVHIVDNESYDADLGPDGRPAGPGYYVPSPIPFDLEYAWFVRGSKRITKTELISKYALDEFLLHVKSCSKPCGDCYRKFQIP